MKSYRYRFENVLTYRELEKTETEAEYQAAIETFEKVATKLYDLLKKKETTIINQEEKLQEGASIDKIHHYMHFIDSLEKNIATTQQQVIRARSKMQWFEQQLLERTMEVRKFEKMREKDREEYRDELESEEAKWLDELSTMAFHGKEDGW